MSTVIPFLIVITLNINVLNTPFKTWRMAKWKRHKIQIYGVSQRLTYVHQKWNNGKIDTPCNVNKTRVGKAMFTSDKIYFNSKIFTEGKKRMLYND